MSTPAINQKVKSLIEQRGQFHGDMKKYKEKYEKYTELYETAGGLLDPDTRKATVLKEGWKGLLKLASTLMGKNIANHPYLKTLLMLNEKGFDLLWQAIAASDSVDNARNELGKAKNELENLKSEGKKFAKKHNKERAEFEGIVAATLRSSPSLSWNWTSYLNTITEAGWKKITRRDAELEIIHMLNSIVPILLKDVRHTVSQALKRASAVRVGAAGLVARGAVAIIAEETYNERIKQLTKKPKNLFEFNFGKSQENQRDWVDLWEGKSDDCEHWFRDQVNLILKPVLRCASAWDRLVREFTSISVLTVGAKSSWLPWELPLPPVGRGKALAGSPRLLGLMTHVI